MHKFNRARTKCRDLNGKVIVLRCECAVDFPAKIARGVAIFVDYSLKTMMLHCTENNGNEQDIFYENIKSVTFLFCTRCL